MWNKYIYIKQKILKYGNVLRLYWVIIILRAIAKTNIYIKGVN